MNTKTSCVRRIHFCAGHRVLGHENKCATPHGHNYYALLTAEAECLDDIGRVIDFSVLKEKVGAWIDQNWDHTFLVYEKDVSLIAALEGIEANKPPYICPFNPTAENMAEYLLKEVAPHLLADSNVQITKVAILETDNCYAEVKLENSLAYSSSH